MFDDLFEQILSGGLLDSSGGICVGIGEGEVEVPTDPDVAVVVVPCLHLRVVKKSKRRWWEVRSLAELSP